jgi:serine/arginine repetitive matrix protein 2
MYNGIGLSTSRGTATSGYVQRNLAFVRPKTKRETFEQQRAAQAALAPEVRRPNAAIIEHERRRKVETKVFELGETLRSQSYALLGVVHLLLVLPLLIFDFENLSSSPFPQPAFFS